MRQGIRGRAHPISSSAAYQPSLDGVRAVSVIAVLLFHAGMSWMTGGYLGVSVFFTLSGFLITRLLLAEHERSGRIDAGAFYARRARRLLPASVVCLVTVCMFAANGAFDGVADLRRDVVGAALQVANWTSLAGKGGYAEQLAAEAGRRSPLTHYWSLAIEEQFYWLWPLTAGLLYTAPITFNGPDPMTLKYFAKDTAGNTSDIATQTYTIPPDTKKILAWIAIIALSSIAMWHLEAGGPVGGL